MTFSPLNWAKWRALMPERLYMRWLENPNELVGFRFC